MQNLDVICSTHYVENNGQCVVRNLRYVYYECFLSEKWPEICVLEGVALFEKWLSRDNHV